MAPTTEWGAFQVIEPITAARVGDAGHDAASFIEALARRDASTLGYICANADPGDVASVLAAAIVMLTDDAQRQVVVDYLRSPGLARACSEVANG
jgi:hypothetical protein